MNSNFKKFRIITFSFLLFQSILNPSHEKGLIWNLSHFNSHILIKWTDTLHLLRGVLCGNNMQMQNAMW